MSKKALKVMCVASLCLSLATGCSVYNGFIKVGQSAVHGTLSSIGISGDKDLSYMIDNYGDSLYGVPYAKINAALDNRLTLGTRKDESYAKSMGVLSVYYFLDEDCNMAMYFDQDDNFNVFTLIAPENVDLTDLPFRNHTDVQMHTAAILTEEKLPFGHCTFARERFKKFNEINGKDKTLLEIQQVMDEERAKQREKNKQEARASLEAQNGQSASSDGLNSEVLNNPGLQQLAMVGQMQQELIKKNTVNGKMRMCTIDTKEQVLILEGTKDGKFRFEKESDKSVVEIDPENLELCQDK